ncbi:hypothetical protein [Confluentibacter citreus]|uniref:hypothetical protein n=1 Tax=Confluentibacter citreus TaxID=2007307 RepID=UPI000C2840F4|nr:hypothetical protein [Confluentibacter citreus]
MTKCIFNNLEIDINSELELTDLIKSGAKNDFNEICIYEKEKTALTILTNKIKNKAFLMFQDLENEKCYTPLILENSSDLFVDFLLSNGQMDEYPSNWLVDIQLAEKAILEYYDNGQMWNGINWAEN